MHILAFIIAMAAFVLGFFLFGLAFSVASFQALIFTAGIIAVSLALFIPMHLLRD